MLIWNQPKEGDPSEGYEHLGGFPFLFLFWWTLLPVLDNHTTAFSPCLFPPKGALNRCVLFTVRPLFRLLFFAKGVAFRDPLGPHCPHGSGWVQGENQTVEAALVVRTSALNRCSGLSSLSTCLFSALRVFPEFISTVAIRDGTATKCMILLPFEHHIYKHFFGKTADFFCPFTFFPYICT